MKHHDEAQQWAGFRGRSIVGVSSHNVALKGHGPFRFITQRWFLAVIRFSESAVRY